MKIDIVQPGGFGLVDASLQPLEVVLCALNRARLDDLIQFRREDVSTKGYKITVRVRFR
jgi:hypothetical protein